MDHRLRKLVFFGRKQKKLLCLVALLEVVSNVLDKVQGETVFCFFMPPNMKNLKEY